MSVTELKEEILPAAFSQKGSTFISCTLDSEYSGGDQFQSNVVFVTAAVREEDETNKIPLVVKFEPFSEEMRKRTSTNLQFHNELLMYSKLLPFLNKSNICEDTFPEFYYGVSSITDPEKDVVVIEDLRPKGYRMTEEKGFLDYEHLKLAMGKLGRFHGLSYSAKKENPEEFYKLTNQLKESTWLDGAVVLPTIKHCFHRALDPLIASGRHADIPRRLLARIDDSIVKLLLELVSADEPMAVVCHGDFCRNNMLFKYDQTSGAPTDVKFFDVAMARYSSPAVDIAFFLLMNSSREMRAAHWDDLLEVYHRSLSDAVSGDQVPSLEDVHREMRLKAVYGFVHASFFLPMMLYVHDFTMDDFSNLSAEEIGVKQAKVGGEEGTKLVTSMVEELVERGWLTIDHPFLKHD